MKVTRTSFSKNQNQTTFNIIKQTKRLKRGTFADSKTTTKTNDVWSLQDEEEKLSGDAALNKVFQDIFARGSEEQKRAMMKSFVESGGTVLSTNWEDVGKRTVECTPPTGMEAHKWNE